jgi:hypothetical protein
MENSPRSDAGNNITACDTKQMVYGTTKAASETRNLLAL